MTFLCNMIQNLIQCSKAQDDIEPYYEVLESITLNGTQMFWLPVKPALDVKIDITFKSDNYASTSCLFGGRINANGSNRKMFAFWQCVGGSSARPDDGYMRADLSNASTGTGDIGKANSTSEWTNIVKDGIYNYLNGVLKVTQTSVTSEFYDDTNTYIALGCMSNGTESNHNLSNPFSGDVAQLKIWKAGTQVADYVPVLNDKMQPCLYNRITKEFLYAKAYPSGSTTTYDLGFKRWNKYDVDYIASDGNQYINTGFKFTNTSAFEITCAEVGAFESSTVLCGARNNTDTTSNARIVDYSYSAPSVLRGEYLLLQRGGYDVNDNVIYIPYDTEFHTYYQSPTRMSIDDTDRPTVPSLTSPNMDFYIFWQNVGTATAPAKAKIKVKSQKLWDNGTLARDYKPVIWHNGNTTAEACLYDKVYNKMYQNAGTGSFKAYIENTLGEPYEVGMYLKTIKTSNGATVGPIIELGEYPQDGIGYHIKTTTTSSNSNYAFGSRKTTDNNFVLITLSGSSTGGTILSSVMGTSITWKSGTTTWSRSTSGTTYECSIQTYKDGNTYKFDAIGYNYTLGKEADRQTQTYPSPIDEQQNAPMLLFGAVNTINILYGNNTHYFFEWNLPNVRHTLLPVINSTHTKICFIDNKTKQIYEFTKIGSYTPSTDNITFKQLDGTIITGTLT